MTDSWQTTTVAAVCSDVVTGGTPRTSNIAFYDKGDIPWLNTKEVNFCRIHRTERSITQSGLDGSSAKWIPENSVIVAMYGATAGKVAINKIPLTTNQACCNLLVDRAKANYNYLYYYLSVNYKRLLDLANGAAQQNLNTLIIKKFPIRIPSLDAQYTIAHILGTLDDKIELNRQMNATLEAMARALFKSWFVDFDSVIDNALAAGNPIPEPLKARAEARKALGDQRKPLPEAIQEQFPDRFAFSEKVGWLPEGWQHQRFGDNSVCYDRMRIPLSKKQRAEKKPGAIPYYGATSVMDYINEWIFDDIYLLVGEDGSVVKEDGSPFVQYIWGKAWVNNHAHVLQGAGGVSTEHLLLFIRQQNMTAYVTGAVQPKINQKNLNSIPFLKATGPINQSFNAVISPIFEKIRSISDESVVLSKLRDTLLPKLLSGQLRITDAEELVAEVT